MATGYGPCRLCLLTFTEGSDEGLLFTYQPFIDFGLPEKMRPLPLVVEGYGEAGALLVLQRVGSAVFEDALDAASSLGSTRHR